MEGNVSANVLSAQGEEGMRNKMTISRKKPYIFASVGRWVAQFTSCANEQSLLLSGKHDSKRDLCLQACYGWDLVK